MRRPSSTASRLVLNPPIVMTSAMSLSSITIFVRMAYSLNVYEILQSYTLHAEKPKFRVLNRHIARGRKTQRQHAARVGRIDDAVVPQARRGEIGVTLHFILITNRRLKVFFFLGTPLLTLALDAITAHRGQHTGRLLATHHGDACVGPHPQKARAISTTAHAVVASTKSATDDVGKFWHRSGRHCRHHLGTIARDAFVLVLAPDHETRDVL